MLKRTSRPLTVWSLSLGCPKNRVDSEHLLGSLPTPVKSVKHIGRARLVFINTCGFITPAVRESVRSVLDVIKAIARCKEKPLLAVAGCMVSRYGVKSLAADLPEVDIWLPTESRQLWPSMLGHALGLLFSSIQERRLLSTGPSYAWLKIAEGCRHRCSFCTIPSIRGKLKSVAADDILEEANLLLSQGVKELAIVAQDCTSWGADFGVKHGLLSLLERLVQLRGMAWLRLLYLYPAGLSQSLLTFIKETGYPLLPYLDIPLQHAHPEILTKMGRPFARNPRHIIDIVRNTLPNAALRTTFIVGYPGETEEHFSYLCRFVEEAAFQHMGVFTYHAEEGTKAAGLPGKIPEKIKKLRKKILMEIQSGISRTKLTAYLGQRLPVLVDAAHSEWPGLHVGRVWFQAPEIDGITYLSGSGVKPGALCECEIVESSTYDLTGLV